MELPGKLKRMPTILRVPLLILESSLPSKYEYFICDHKIFPYSTLLSAESENLSFLFQLVGQLSYTARLPCNAFKSRKETSTKLWEYVAIVLQGCRKKLPDFRFEIWIGFVQIPLWEWHFRRCRIEPNCQIKIWDLRIWSHIRILDTYEQTCDR